MNLERFEEHLRHPVGRGAEPAAARSGAAGGAACGDLVRLSVAVAGERVADAGFEASGCGATIAAASAAVALARGRPLLDAARVGSADIAAELGGLSPGKLHAAELAADALHRALGCGRARRRRAAPPAPGRVLVAMSGGVDSAVAALLCARDEGAEVVAVTLELWRDPENDGERSCCSADAVRGARALAHRMGLAHLTLDLRDEFRAGVVEPWLADHARRADPEPVRALQRPRAPRRDARRSPTASAPARWPPATTRASPTTGCCAPPPTRPRTRATCSPRWRPPRSARMRFPLGELTKPQVRALAAEAGLPVARQARLAGPLLPRRHGPGPRSWPATAASRERPGDLVDRARAARRPPPRPSPLHRRPAARARRGRQRRAALRARRPTRPPTPSRSARATSWPPTASRSRPAAAPCRRRPSTRSGCATAPGRCACTLDGVTLRARRAGRRRRAGPGGGAAGRGRRRRMRHDRRPDRGDVT